MTIKSTPPISMTDIPAEFGGSVSLGLFAYYRGGQYVPSSVTKVPASGPVSLFDYLDTRKSVPGTMNYDEAGTFTFTVPAYITMTVEIAGAGGGGASSVWDGGSFVGGGGIGAAGGDTSFLGLKAAGGGGGGAAAGARHPWQVYPGAKGATGGAAGGEADTPGGGSIGGIGGSLAAIGGGSNGDGGIGGTGGLTRRTYKLGDAGAPTVGQTITLIVGAGGIAHPGIAGPPNTAANGAPGTNGRPGYVHISWT